MKKTWIFLLAAFLLLPFVATATAQPAGGHKGITTQGLGKAPQAHHRHHRRHHRASMK
jgi:hypothetical protein